MPFPDFYNGKKVFITGHTGFKGSWLSRLLLACGAEITGYALEATEQSLYNLLKLGKDIISIIGDIRDRENLVKSVKDSKSDIIIHMAAQPLVRKSYESPAYTFETNVMGTVNILEALRECDSARSFLNVTTDKVYENKEWHWGYRENEPLCGYDPYSNSKSCSELVTYSYKNSFFKDSNTAISTARSGNVIGGGDFSKDRIIPDCAYYASIGEPIIIRNPFSTRPYQHVLECLSGYLLLTQRQWENKSEYSGSYNFGPNDKSCVTTGQLTDMFCRFWGRGTEWINKSDGGPHEANFLKLDCSKSKSVLGWIPNWDIEKAVQKTVEWYTCYYNGGDVSLLTDKQIIDYLKNN
ncbi:MAG: CDP-glucose 4,6-dehydratase [Eubacteriales bacterium]|nr:CDP-glucose 4,6-dehydratase [Eubacteriales bacterium]MDD4475858.1 CDP-glucose 4,6-dehydratase [Eubacteriales bacterium]